MQRVLIFAQAPASLHSYYSSAKLGVPLNFPYAPGDDSAWLNVGNVGFGLVQTSEVPKLDYLDIHSKIRPIVEFQVDNIHEAHTILRENGVQTSEMDHSKEGGYGFFINDPDGHLVRLWGGWPFGEEQ